MGDRKTRTIFALDGSFMTKRVPKRTALVTGGVEGIGRAVVLRLVEDGFRVAVNYRDAGTKKQALSVARILESKNKEFMFIQADIANEKEVQKMLDEVGNRLGRLDVVINNAGINLTQGFRDASTGDLDRVFGVNMWGAIWVTKYSLPLLQKAVSPRIIFISSVNSFVGSVNRSAYITSKSAILGLSKALALELAPKILVNAVAPGYINTSMLKKFSKEPLSKKLQRIPLKRFGRPEEVASVISFLCSADSSYITGQCIHVNGGMFLS